MVGKYVELPDAYKSVNEALLHAGIQNRVKVQIDYVNAEELESQDVNEVLKDMDAILVPGGFGERGTEGKMQAIKFARENGVPFLGICLGMQLAVIEYARNVVGISDASSTEFNRSTKSPLIGLITEWLDERGEVQQRNVDSDLGWHDASWVLKNQNWLKALKHVKCMVQQILLNVTVTVMKMNNRFIPALEEAGMKISGYSPVQHLVETVEIPQHPWFIAVQFHPEFTSSPRDGHPLFASFIDAAKSTVQKSEVIWVKQYN